MTNPDCVRKQEKETLPIFQSCTQSIKQFTNEAIAAKCTALLAIHFTMPVRLLDHSKPSQLH